MRIGKPAGSPETRPPDSQEKGSKDIIGKSKPLSLSASRVSSIRHSCLLSNKHKGNTNELSLSINGIICRDQYAVSNHLCEYFATAADGIGDTSAADDKVLATHPSVKNIR